MPARHCAGGLLAALAGLSCLTAAGCAAGKTAATTAHDQPGSHARSGTPGGTPAIPSTVLPAQLGNTWVYAVDSSVLGRGAETARISAVTPVAGGLPAGSYQATLLEQTITDGPGSQDVLKTWVVNGIGQVKTEITVSVKGERAVSSVQTLTSFTKG